MYICHPSCGRVYQICNLWNSLLPSKVDILFFCSPRPQSRTFSLRSGVFRPLEQKSYFTKFFQIKPIPLPEEKSSEPSISVITPSASETLESKVPGNSYANQPIYQFSSSPALRRSFLDESITSTSGASPSNVISPASAKAIKKTKVEYPVAVCVICNLHGTNQNAVE